MSFNAAALKLMLEKGLTLGDVAEIAEANERRCDRTATERKQRQRQRERSRRDVTRDKVSNDIDILTFQAPPNVISDEITPPPENSELKPEHVVEAWNAMAERTGLAAVRKLTPERRRKLCQRIRQNTIDEFTEAIAAIETTPFLRGDNDRGWRADFDFLLSPTKFTKLTEGTYGR